MPDDLMPSGMDGGSGQFEMVRFPDGRPGWVPTGYGQAAQNVMSRMTSGGQRNSADTIGTFADGFEAVQQFYASGDMQRDLDDADDLVAELDACRDSYAYFLSHSTFPAGSGYSDAGALWKRIQVLQDKRDYLQERVLSSQIKLNYGAGIAAGGRVAGRLLGGDGGGMFGGAEGGTEKAILLGVAGFGLYTVLSDRNRRRSTRDTTRRYG